MTEREITSYIRRCRQSVDGFSERTFSLEGTLALYRKTVHKDVFRYPLSALLAVPLFAAKRVLVSLEAMGSEGAERALRALPSGLKKARQDELELLIELQLFEHLPEPRELREAIRHEMKVFAASRADVSDMISAGSSGLLGFLVCGKWMWSVSDIGQALADGFARKKATSDFFLGESLGNFYYELFPVSATPAQVAAMTAAAIALCALLTISAGIWTEPLQNRLGVQKRKLRAMLDRLEVHLLLVSRGRFDDATGQGKRWRESCTNS